MGTLFSVAGIFHYLIYPVERLLPKLLNNQGLSEEAINKAYAQAVNAIQKQLGKQKDFGRGSIPNYGMFFSDKNEVYINATKIKAMANRLGLTPQQEAEYVEAVTSHEYIHARDAMRRFNKSGARGILRSMAAYQVPAYKAVEEAWVELRNYPKHGGEWSPYIQEISNFIVKKQVIKLLKLSIPLGIAMTGAYSEFRKMIGDG